MPLNKETKLNQIKAYSRYKIIKVVTNYIIIILLIIDYINYYLVW